MHVHYDDPGQDEGKTPFIALTLDELWWSCIVCINISVAIFEVRRVVDQIENETA